MYKPSDEETMKLRQRSHTNRLIVLCLSFMVYVQWHSKRSSLRLSFIIWREIIRFGLVSFGPLPSELLSDGSVCDLSGALVASLCVCLPSVGGVGGLYASLLSSSDSSSANTTPGHSCLRHYDLRQPAEQNNQPTTKKGKKTVCQENRLDTHCLKEKE